MKRKENFDEFLKQFEEMDAVFETFFKGLRHGEIKGLSEPLYYGITTHVGPEGVPEVTHFGNIKPELTEDIYSESREPFSDVIFDEKTKEAIVTLEMPGVEKKDINIVAEENLVEIKAETETKKYYKKV